MFQSVSKNVKQGDLRLKLEPALGFEPRTDGLQNRSSTAELSRPGEAGHCISIRSVSESAVQGDDRAGNIIWHIFSKSQTLSLYFSRFRGIV